MKRAATAVLALLAVAACGERGRQAGEGEAADAAGSAGTPVSEASQRRAPVPIPDSIRAELVAMGAADQADREGMSAERLQDTAFLRTLMRRDSARSLRLREIVHRWGWPDTARAGGEAADAAFLVIQHSPMDGFREAVLPMMEAAAADGRMPAADVAMLVDRVLVHRGEPQRYGTQFALEDGRLVAHPVEDPAGLDERRRAMELPPMDEYMRVLAESYDAEVVGPDAVDPGAEADAAGSTEPGGS